MTRYNLPDKLSDMIMLALDCLDEVEADERYIVDVWVWHDLLDRSSPATKNINLAFAQGKYIDEVQASVCPCGAIMAKRLGAPATNHHTVGDFGVEVNDKFHALDKIKHGEVRRACRYWGIGGSNTTRLVKVLEESLGVEYNKDEEEFSIVEYHDDPATFKQNLCVIADALREMGL